MTEQEIIERYKDLTLKFVSYYSNYNEYEFVYAGITEEGKTLTVLNTLKI